MPRAPLSRDDVIEAALDIVESEGLSALSMRVVASKLGVAVTAIYWHVGSREQLEQAMVERIGYDIFSVKTRGRTPQARVLSTARSLYAALQTHTQLAGLAHRRGRLLELLTPARRVLAETFAEAGLRPAAAVDAANVVMQFVGDYTTARYVAAGWPDQVLNEPLGGAGGGSAQVRLERALQKMPDEARVFEMGLAALVRGLLPAGKI